MLLVVVLCVAMVGCKSDDKPDGSAGPDKTIETPKGNDKEKEPEPEYVAAEDGYAEGRVGATTFNTIFFDYIVKEVSYADKYEDYEAEDGMILVDAVIEVKNTFGEALPMYNDDFQIQWHDLGDGDEDYGYGIIMEDSKTVMPYEWELKRADKQSYHVVFEVPEDACEFSISYLEFFDDGSEGDVFFTFFERDDSKGADIRL